MAAVACAQYKLPKPIPWTRAVYRVEAHLHARAWDAPAVAPL